VEEGSLSRTLAIDCGHGYAQEEYALCCLLRLLVLVLQKSPWLHHCSSLSPHRLLAGDRFLVCFTATACTSVTCLSLRQSRCQYCPVVGMLHVHCGNVQLWSLPWLLMILVLENGLAYITEYAAERREERAREDRSST